MGGGGGGGLKVRGNQGKWKLKKNGDSVLSGWLVGWLLLYFWQMGGGGGGVKGQGKSGKMKT